MRRDQIQRLNDRCRLRSSDVVRVDVDPLDEAGRVDENRRRQRQAGVLGGTSWGCTQGCAPGLGGRVVRGWRRHDAQLSSDRVVRVGEHVVGEFVPRQRAVRCVGADRDERGAACANDGDHVALVGSQRQIAVGAPTTAVEDHDGGPSVACCMQGRRCVGDVGEVAVGHRASRAGEGGRVEAEGLSLSFRDLGGQLSGISLTAEVGLEEAQFGVESLHSRGVSAVTHERG